MFGQDNQQQQTAQDWQQPAADQTNPAQTIVGETTVTDSLEVPPSELASTSTMPAVDFPQQNSQQVATTSDDGWSSSSPDPGAAQSTSTSSSFTTPPQLDMSAASELIEIKQKALNELSPLVNQLDQTPEEKFKTTMMLIQASDNQALIPDAYAAAQSITDEKIKAQALLDVINEINYFTQQQNQHN